MDLFEFTGKLIFEDLPTLVFEKIPEIVEDSLDKTSDAIDKFLE